MAWKIIKYIREVFLAIMVLAGLALFIGSRWFQFVPYLCGLLMALAALVADSKDWKAPAQSPLTRLSKLFQGENGFPHLMLVVYLPAFFVSVLLGWVIGKL